MLLLGKKGDVGNDTETDNLYQYAWCNVARPHRDTVSSILTPIGVHTRYSWSHMLSSSFFCIHFPRIKGYITIRITNLLTFASAVFSIMYKNLKLIYF